MRTYIIFSIQYTRMENHYNEWYKTNVKINLYHTSVYGGKMFGNNRTYEMKCFITLNVGSCYFPNFYPEYILFFWFILHWNMKQPYHNWHLSSFFLYYKNRIFQNRIYKANTKLYQYVIQHQCFEKYTLFIFNLDLSWNYLAKLSIILLSPQLSK